MVRKIGLIQPGRHIRSAVLEVSSIVRGVKSTSAVALGTIITPAAVDDAIIRRVEERRWIVVFVRVCLRG